MKVMTPVGHPNSFSNLSFNRIGLGPIWIIFGSINPTLLKKLASNRPSQTERKFHRARTSQVPCRSASPRTASCLGQGFFGETCMYVCMYVYTHIFMHIYLNILPTCAIATHTYVHARIRSIPVPFPLPCPFPSHPIASLRLATPRIASHCMPTYVPTYLPTYIATYIHIYVYVYVYVYVHTHVCIYICII